MPPMLLKLLPTLDRINREHPWSHNDGYSRVVLRAARRVRRDGGTRALDVGCGTGRLVTRLAGVMPEVTGIEPDPATAEQARRAVAALPNARVVQATWPPTTRSPATSTARPADGDRADDPAATPAAGYDLVSLVAVLHHLPLTDGLRAARLATAPGGRLVVVGVYREARRDQTLSLLSLLLNPLIGLARHPRRATAPLPQTTAPTADPTEAFLQIRRVMRRELPGVRVHRGLFWRYVATWHATSTAMRHN